MRHVMSVAARRGFTTAVAALLIVGLAGAVAAQPGWAHLGTKEIEGKADHDKIRVHGKDTYRALQFRVNGAAVQFDRVVGRVRQPQDPCVPVPHPGAAQRSEPRARSRRREP